jgi:hypothetical protein
MPSQIRPKKKQPVECCMPYQAADAVEHAKSHTRLLPPTTIYDGAHKAAENSRCYKACNEELACLIVIKSLFLEKAVEIRPLQPICSYAQAPAHQES